MCTSCHLAPGLAQTELRQGLYPQPPDLSKHGVHDPAEAFWVIKHGVKLTAMPAWGRSHDDAAIWDMVAFVRQLPAMDQAAFEAMAGRAADDGHGGDEHIHHHDEASHDHADAEGHDHEH
jgi:mono/diheme cytochrome c family protein